MAFDWITPCDIFYKLLLENLHLEWQTRSLDLISLNWSETKSFQSEVVTLTVRYVTCNQKFSIARMNGKLAPLKVKMTSRKQFSCNCMIERTKSKFETLMTSYGPNKNLDDELINITGYVQGKFIRLNKKQEHCSNTTFSLYFKIRFKKIYAAKSIAFSLPFTAKMIASIWLQKL